MYASDHNLRGGISPVAAVSRICATRSRVRDIEAAPDARVPDQADDSVWSGMFGADRGGAHPLGGAIEDSLHRPLGMHRAWTQICTSALEHRPAYTRAPKLVGGAG